MENILPNGDIEVTAVFNPITGGTSGVKAKTTLQLTNDVTALQKDVKQLKSDVADLKTRVGKIEEDVADLKTRVTKIEKDVADLKTDMKSVHDKLDQLLARGN